MANKLMGTFIGYIFILYLLVPLTPLAAFFAIGSYFTPASEGVSGQLEPGESPTKYIVVRYRNGVAISSRPATQADIEARQKTVKAGAIAVLTAILFGMIIGIIWLNRAILKMRPKKSWLRNAGLAFLILPMAILVALLLGVYRSEKFAGAESLFRAAMAALYFCFGLRFLILSSKKTKSQDAPSSHLQ